MLCETRATLGLILHPVPGVTKDIRSEETAVYRGRKECFHPANKVKGLKGVWLVQWLAQCSTAWAHGDPLVPSCPSDPSPEQGQECRDSGTHTVSTLLNPDTLATGTHGHPRKKILKTIISNEPLNQKNHFEDK